ncbi:histidine kinase [Streptomyces sp. CB03911]|uniref:sensor histidine kinase n=1 Tax=Streptomyces sp. CB03911 TaxID=1804758 RepID=UPI0018FE5318|nr:histidine kinase [Streptomyces sp. CB03911]
MSGPTTSVGGAQERIEDARRFVRGGIKAQLRCLHLVFQAALGPAALFFVGLVPILVLNVGTQHGLGSLLTVAAGVVAFPAACFWLGRRYARRSRDLVEAWFGVRIPVAYRPAAVPQQDERGHWWTGHSYHSRRSTARAELTVRSVLGDPASWRDVLWMVGGAGAAGLLAVPCLLLTVVGAGAAVGLLEQILDDSSYYSAGDPRELLLQLGLCLAAVVAGLALAPRAVRLHADWTRRALDPDRANGQSKARLTERVQQLTETRADAVGNQAAELRRIERDLHDGAQARLVAIGMTLGTIEHLMDSDPPAARALLSEARQSSAKALQELRDLVRGIHPPVLAERGLGDAVRALAMDSALPVDVCVSLPDRPAAPVEAAVYFSVCELLANAAKHSGADQVWVDILHRAGTLRVTVTDDGHGVADPTRGSGLRGIERRLGTFDGVLAIDSTSGGPTTITLELPCELSSPRTSTSFAKA